MKKKFNHTSLKNCRVCDSNKLINYINLGNHPPSNSFIEKKDFSNEQKFPLKVLLCENCGLSQLDTIVSASDIFDEYLYLSSTSKALVSHYKDMVKTISKKFKLSDNSLVVDIGCNDGITLENYSSNLNILGIEPSSASVYAEKKGIKIENIFFNKKNSDQLVQKYGKAKIITATNVFAHVDDIKDFVLGIKNFLDNDGVFIIEFPYLKYMIEDNLFDVIYHEHLSYLSITPLKYLFSEFGLKIFDIEEINIGASGPALRVYICLNVAKYKTDKKVSNFLEMEKELKFKDPNPYFKFAKRVQSIKNNILSIIRDLNKNNNIVGAFGAPAKGNTMLNYLDINKKDILAVADNTPVKIGKFTPGSQIPIVSDEDFEKMNVNYALLLSWNYLDFFLKKSDFIKNSGKFIVPFPKVNILPK